MILKHVFDGLLEYNYIKSAIYEWIELIWVGSN